MVSGDKKKISWISRLWRQDVSHDDDFESFEEMDGEFFDEEVDDPDSEMTDSIFYDEKQSSGKKSEDGSEDLQINLIDKGDTLVAQAFVPGLEDDEIEVDLNREMLTITTNSNEHCVETDGDCLYEELVFGAFSRSILLPSEIEVEESKADVKDGVLTVSMPKIDKAARKKLSIKKR